jgi:hypothetical protein
VLGVFGVKVRWRVIREVHLDDDAVNLQISGIRVDRPKIREELLRRLARQSQVHRVGTNVNV